MRQAVKTLQIIHLALVSGQIILSLISLFMVKKFTISLDITRDTFLIIVPLIAIISIVLSYFLFRKLSEKMTEKKSNFEKLNTCRSAYIVRYAIMESASLFAIVWYMSTGNFTFMLVAILLIIIQLTARPASSAIATMLGIHEHLLE